MARLKFSDRRSHTKRQQQAGAKPAKKKVPTSRKLSHSVPIITLRWGNKKLEIDNFVKLLTSTVQLFAYVVVLLTVILPFIRTINPQLLGDTPTATITYTFTAVPTWTSGPTDMFSVTATPQSTYTPSPPWILATTATPIPTNPPTESLPPKPTHTANPSPTSTTTLLPTITLIPTQSITITSTSTSTATATNMSTGTLLPSYTLTTSSTPTYISIPIDTPSVIATSTSSDTATYTPLVTLTPTSIDSMTPIPSGTPSPSSTPTPLQVSTLSATSTPTWTQTQTVTTTPFLTYTPTPTPAINEDGQGCSPGYWKNHLESWAQTGYSQTDDFDKVFEVDVFNPDITLEQALSMQGDGDARLARHGTAAILNAAHPNLHYPLTVTQVIALVKVEDTDTLEEFNDSICPLK